MPKKGTWLFVVEWGRFSDGWSIRDGREEIFAYNSVEAMEKANVPRDATWMKSWLKRSMR